MKNSKMDNRKDSKSNTTITKHDINAAASYTWPRIGIGAPGSRLGPGSCRCDLDVNDQEDLLLLLLALGPGFKKCWV